MSDTQTPELSPEAKAVMARARKSFLLSMGLLVAGMAIIGGILVFRTPGSSAPAGGDYALASVKVPAGAEVVSAVAADGKLTVTYRAGSATSIRVFNGQTGELMREVPVVAE